MYTIEPAITRRSQVQIPPATMTRRLMATVGPPAGQRLGKRWGCSPRRTGFAVATLAGMIGSSDEGLRGASAAYAKFREAVLDLSEDPTKANIERYLNASRAVDGESQEGPLPRQRGRNAQESSK